MGRPKLVDGFDPEKLGVNPFVANLTVFASKKRVAQSLVNLDDYSDEIFLGVKENREFEFTLEVNRFTKVFHGAVIRKQLAKMPSRAKELLLWVMFELEPGVDYVVINIQRYEKENDVSHNTYLRAVEDLITTSVLCGTIWKKRVLGQPGHPVLRQQAKEVLRQYSNARTQREMMVIENKFNIGDIVYLKTDRDQSPRIVFGLVVRSGGVLYEIASGTNTSIHYDFELSVEANVIITSTN